jgi:hypothetical protein
VGICRVTRHTLLGGTPDVIDFDPAEMSANFPADVKLTPGDKNSSNQKGTGPVTLTAKSAAVNPVPIPAPPRPEIRPLRATSSDELNTPSALPVQAAAMRATPSHVSTTTDLVFVDPLTLEL